MSQEFHFINAGNEYCTMEKYVPAPYFRRTFNINGEVKSAILTITGLGYYELHFNGKNITKGYMAPYRSNPTHIIYFDSYDVTEELTSGKNVIAVILGNGMQNPLGAYIWHFETAGWRSAPKLAFELKIDYKDGHSESVSSDRQTKTAPSPILFDDVHYGEYYDSRLEIENWDRPEFDDCQWCESSETDSPGGEYRLCEAEPIVVRSELLPVSVTPYEDGYIYDFGTNNAGLCRLCIKNATAGQKILLLHFEMLYDGKPYTDNIRFNHNGITDRYQEDIYYCAGKEAETYVPHFTYHGFRYVYVTGITPYQASSDLLTYLVINSDLEETGSFTCDDEIINKLQEATVRSDLSNFHYFPTDCPQREKNGWTADASLSAEQMLLNLNPEKSYREWMRNIYKAMNEKGQLPGIIPTTGWGYEWGNGPAWDNVIVNLPYYTYIYRGDTLILKELSAPLMRYLLYIDRRLDENCLIAIGLGDWCEIGKRNGEEPSTPLIVTDSILTVDIARKAAFIFEVLHETENQQYAAGLAEKITAAVKKHLIDHNTMTVMGNTQTAQSMALYYGMFTKQEHPKALAQLLELIKNKDNHLATGVLGNRVIFRVLADNGYADLAYEMISRPDYPSFGNWILMGATSLWESFFLENRHPLYSLNHHFWGDISAWFYTYLAGIRINPTGHDINEINIAPCFVKKINNVEATKKLPDGTLSVHWTRKNSNIILSVSVPQSIKGMIILPKNHTFDNGTNQKALNSGIYNITY